MTTPGGVPNLPQGALTPGTLASSLQDMSEEAMRARGADGMPGIFHSSSGGDPLFDLSPNGIITRIWAVFNSLVANADPIDIQGPDDLPGLLIDFIEDLPVIGTFVGLLEAILGTYDGDDPILLAVQDVFALIRNIFGGIGAAFGLPDIWGDSGVGLEQISNVVNNVMKIFGTTVNQVIGATASFDPTAILQNFISAMLLPLNMLAQLVAGLIPGAQIPGLDASKIVSGLFAPSRVQNLEGILNNFGRAFTGVPGTYTGLNDIYNAFLNFRTRLGGGSNNLDSIQRILDENDQTKQILAGFTVAPINSLITSIRNWFDTWF